MAQYYIRRKERAVLVWVSECMCKPLAQSQPAIIHTWWKKHYQLYQEEKGKWMNECKHDILYMLLVLFTLTLTWKIDKKVYL